MSTNEQDNANENNPGDESPEERLDRIKQEEKEDASSYYAQGKPEEKDTTEQDFSKPVPPVDEEKEEMSLLKAIAFLGFGMAAVAIVFILFFIRDLDSKVGDVDAAVDTLEKKFGPLKQQVDERLTKVDKNIDNLNQRVGHFERQATVTELKRALVAIEGVTSGATPEVQAKSDQVIASIQSLLHDLGDDSMGPPPAPLELSVEPAPPAPAEPAMEESAPAEEPMAEAAPAEEEPPAEEPAPAAEPEAPAEEKAVVEVEVESSGGGGDDEDDEEDEDDE